MKVTYPEIGSQLDRRLEQAGEGNSIIALLDANLRQREVPPSDTDSLMQLHAAVQEHLGC